MLLFFLKNFIVKNFLVLIFIGDCMIFVDRHEELSLLRKAVDAGASVMILSLRGYGKTALLKVFHKAFMEDGVPGVYVNCLRIYSGRDLLDIFAENLMEIALNIPQFNEARKSFLSLIPRRVDSKKALDLVFRFSSENEIRFIIFDEISTLLARFGMRNPYRGYGGAVAVAEHIKGLLDTYAVPIITADTSLESIYTLTRDYSAPLFKEMKQVIFLEPLSFCASIGLIKSQLKAKDKILSEESIIRLAEATFGVPLYIVILTSAVRTEASPEDIENTLHDELLGGTLNAYFKLLFEKFSPTEQEILAHLSRKLSRASEIVRRIPSAYSILEILVRKGIIRKVIKSRKETHYLITDKLFEAWLQMHEFGEYRKVSEQRLKILSYGFEALIREALFSIDKSVIIEDVLGRKISVGPYRKVIRYEGALGEIDAIAYIDRNNADIYEITVGLADQEKVVQLAHKIAIAENTGVKVSKGILIAYMGFTKEAIDKAKYLIEGGARIYLLEKPALKIIAKEGKTRLP